MSKLAHAEAEPGPVLEAALHRIGATADARDAAPVPAFPEDAFRELERVGATTFTAADGTRRPPAAAELELVRDVARADGSVGRIFDGHLNAAERLAVQAPPELAERELAAIRSCELRAGVWGGDPVGGEGPPATVIGRGREEVLRGVKTFCSGAGGIQRALILGRVENGGPPISVWVDVGDTRRVKVDPSWYRSHGLRASVSHRVVFEDAPVIARLGPPGGISAEPWFSRDALRTAASWAGMADAAVQAAIRELAARPGHGPLEDLAAGRMLTAQRTISAWLAEAARLMDAATPQLTTDAGPAQLTTDAGTRQPTTDAAVAELAVVAVQARAAISDACRVLLDEAARACGSRPFAHGGRLDRARRDLEVFLLQHRLDPLLARTGGAALDEAMRVTEQRERPAR